MQNAECRTAGNPPLQDTVGTWPLDVIASHRYNVFGDCGVLTES